MRKPSLLSSIGKVSTPLMPSKPMPLILDEEGRTVDSSGRTIQLSVKHSTAQVCHLIQSGQVARSGDMSTRRKKA